MKTDTVGYLLSPQQEDAWYRGTGVHILRTRVEIQITGVDGDSLSRALSKVCGRHEILRARYYFGEDGLTPIQSFDSDPLQGFTLQQVAAGCHTVSIDVPALTLDLASVTTLAQELAEELAITPTRSADDPMQYADIAAWLRDERDRHPVSDSQRALIAAVCDDRRPLTGRTATAEFQHRRISVPVDPSSCPLELALVAWALLIARHRGTNSVEIGLVSNGRELPELHGLVGPLATTLPLRGDIRISDTVRDLHVRLVQESSAAGRYLRSRGAGSSWPPLQFETRSAKPRMTNGSQDLRVLTWDSACDRFRLKLVADEDLTLHYDGACVPEDAAEMLADRLATVLSEISRQPSRSAWNVPLLTPKEHAAALALGEGRRLLAPTLSLHQLVAAAGAEAPQNVAVVCGEDSVTYDQLRHRAAAVTSLLRHSGVSPGSIVAAAVPRSIDAIAAMLGILQAGAVWMPLPEGAPRHRQEVLLYQAGPAAVLWHPEFGDVPRLERIRHIPFDLGCVHAQETSAAIGADGAYLLFTSGSTGKPKAVLIGHAEIVHYVSAVQAVLGEVNSFASVTSLSTDLGHTAVFGALATGRTLHLIPAAIASDAPGLAQYLFHQPVDVLKITPSYLMALLTHAGSGVLPRRVLVLGGERLDWEVVHSVRRFAPNLRIINHYGPTETTVGVTAYEVGEVRNDCSSVPVGRPLDRVLIRVLDSAGDPTPIGVEGEVVVAGPAVAVLGYLGEAGGSDRRFGADPFVKQLRSYRTGDRARWLVDGNLELLGRTDDQVKIAGHRVELGELEATLARHPEVAVSTVTVLTRDGEPPRLIAFVVPQPGTTPGQTALRAFLAEHLPPPMVPSEVRTLSELPRLPSGKVDRKALALLGDLRRTRAPAPGVEAAIAVHWANVLAIRSPGAEDDFFSSGGHSLAAMTLIARVARELGVRLRLADMFAAPTIAGLARRVEVLRDAPSIAVPSAPEVSRPRTMPLTDQQHALWAAGMMAVRPTVYNLPLTLRIEGKIAAADVQRALQALVCRHEALRVVFELDGEVPCQRVLHPDATTIPLSVRDLGEIPENERFSRACEIASSDARAVLDFSSAPLMRAILLQIASEDHVLALTLHHLIADGLSLEVLVRDLSALLAGQKRPPAPSYCEWVEKLQGRAVDAGYWERLLEPGIPRLDLRGFSQGGGNAAVPVRFAFGAELSESVRRLATEHGSTQFAVLLAGLQALLCLISGETSIWVACPIAQRDEPGFDDLVALTIETIPIVAAFHPSDSFDRRLDAVMDEVRSALDHRPFPAATLLARGACTDAVRQAFKQVVFSFSSVPAQSMVQDGIRVQRVPIDTGARDAITFAVGTAEDGLFGVLQYSQNELSLEGASRLCGLWLQLLAAATARPQTSIEDLPLMGAEEKALRIAAGTGPHTPRNHPERLEQLVWRTAQAVPDQVAVIQGDERMKYNELILEAESIATALTSIGVGPGHVVGLLAERSPAMVAGLLGILRSGAAFLPIDSDIGLARFHRMKDEAALQVVVAPDDRSTATAKLGLPVIGAKSPRGPRVQPRRVVPTETAYVLYTSGSTGEPKGVLCPHAGAVNRLLWMRDTFPILSNDKILHKAPLGFDVAIWELLLPLLAGVPLVLARPGTVDASGVAEAIEQHAVTYIHFVPSLLQDLVNHLQVGRCLTLRRIVCSGEALSRALVDRVRELVPGVELVNLYGPTEASIDVTWHRVDSHGSAVPIGKPIDNVEVHVVDANGRPVPVGVPGEICISGVALANGYLGRPMLTLERFQPHGWRTGAHWYRTGDRGRWRVDDNIEYLGRNDNQIKLRGVRIEPAEVERALTLCPGIRAAAVSLDEQATGLNAYIVVDDRHPPETASLRRTLREHLFEALIPTRFYSVDALPLTSSGKLDRTKLRTEVAGRRSLPRVLSRVAPSSVLSRLSTIWCELLGTPAVDGDDFFVLGGHSLSAVRLVARIRQEFGVPVSARAVFEHSTLGELAVHVAALTSTRPDVIRVADESAVARAPVTPAQNRILQLQGVAPHAPLFNMHVAYLLVGNTDVQRLRTAIAGVVARHAALRVIFLDGEGGAEQHLLPPFSLPLTPMSLEAYSLDGAVTRAIEADFDDAHEGFDISVGPLFRARLLLIDGNTHLLAFTVHHAICDGWSLSILLGEVGALYRGDGDALQPDVPSFLSQVLSRSNESRRVEIARQLAYWTQKLGAVCEESVHNPRAVREKATTLRAGAQQIDWPGAISGIAPVLASERATPFIALAAGLLAVLRNETGQDEVRIGTLVAGRTDPSSLGCVGLFTNTAVLCTDLAGADARRDVLRRVRQAALEMYENQDVPFELVTAALEKAHSHRVADLFSVMLIVHGDDPGHHLDLGDVEIHPIAADRLGPDHVSLTSSDLVIALRVSAGAVAGTCRYKADRLTNTAVGALLESWRCWLEKLA